MNISQVYSLVNKPEDEIQKAISELKAYSDRELSNLGVARSNIEFVVRNGRPRFDQDPRNLGLNRRQSIAA